MGIKSQRERTMKKGEWPRQPLPPWGQLTLHVRYPSDLIIILKKDV